MEPSGLLRVLQNAVSGSAFESLPSIDSQLTVRVPRDEFLAIARTLRDHPDLRFALLVDVTAVDYWPREPRFEVVYTLVSIEKALRLRVKIALSGSDAVVPTVSAVWPAANWLEREVWDLLGIAFDGHPDPRRLLMPDDWQGHPLRKDYPVQVKKSAATSMPLQVTEEEFRANLERDRLKRG